MAEPEVTVVRDAERKITLDRWPDGRARFRLSTEGSFWEGGVPHRSAVDLTEEDLRWLCLVGGPAVLPPLEVPHA